MPADPAPLDCTTSTVPVSSDLPAERAHTVPVSAVFIGLNEARQLPDALASVAFCAELVLLDSGSTDATAEIVERHGGKVFQQPWLGFGLQKQCAVEKARHDWVLCLDCDERVSPELANSIRTLFAKGAPSPGVYRFARSNFFIDRYLKHGEGYPDYSPRLFHRGVARWSADAVHEKVVFEGDARPLAGDLLHRSAESLEVYLNKQNRYTTLQAGMIFESGKCPSLTKMWVSPMVRFLKFTVVRGGWRDGWPGVLHIAIGCMNSFLKYAKARALFAQKG